MSLVAKVAKNTIFQIVGKSIGMFFGLITVALMTRYLGREGFGFYTIIISYLQFFGTLIDFGLQMTTAKILSGLGVNQDKVFSNILSLRIASSLLFFSLAVLLIWFIPYPMTVKVGAMIGVFSFFFISLQTVVIGLYQKNLAMAEVAIAEVFGRLTLLIGVWLTVTFNWGFYPIIISVSVGSLVNFLWLFLKSFKYARYRLAWDKKVMASIWEIAWPLAITVSLTLVYFRADTIILSFFRPAEDVGIYGSAYKVLEILIQFPYLFCGLMLPILTNFYFLNKGLFNKTVQKIFDFLSIIAIPMVFATWLLAEKIIIFVAGDDFALASRPLSILIIATALIYFGTLFSYSLVASGLQKKMIRFYLFNAIFSLIVYLIFIPIYGYMAAASLTVVTEAIIVLSAFYVLRKNISLKLNFRVFLRAIMASLVMVMVLMILSSQHILTLVIVGGLVYLTFLYLFKGFQKEELKEIFSFKNLINK